MGYRALYGEGYAAGAPTEDQWVFLPPRWKGNGTRRGVVWCHGATGTAKDIGDEVRVLAEDFGLPVISADLGGPTTWGNDASVARLGDAWSHLKTVYGAKTDKVLLFGASMGGATALNYLRATPANVAALGLLLPPFNVDDIHDNDRGGLGFAAQIEAAYGGIGAWNAAEPVSNPINQLAAFAAGGVPIRAWYASDDAICLPAHVTTFAAGVPQCRSVSMGAVGHTVAAFHAGTLGDFFAAYKGDP